MVQNNPLCMHRVCSLPCSQATYKYGVNLQSTKTVANDPSFIGDNESREYFIIWIYYMSLYVEEKIEKYLYGFDTALVSLGGSMGLFLGWSCRSILMKMIDSLILKSYCTKCKDRKKTKQFSK